MYKNENIIPLKRIENIILIFRGKKVILDSDLALLYGVTTKRLNEQVKRNIGRFPEDFMFQLNESEKKQVVAICDHLTNLKYSPNLPYVFTEHGAIMAASVLNSPKAVEISIFVVRAFIRLREELSKHKELSSKLTELERKLMTHDTAIKSLITAIRELMSPQKTKKREIGFHADLKGKKK